ncbi:hypothetical protein BC829DRAFT_448891 [Chytridium lagenaria]|nr:hypothetical protein BC829DRAFT_448891 [Chytridium lagenaria]
MPLKEDVSVDNDVFDDAVETFTHPAKESPGSVPLVNGAGASSSQTSGSLKLDGFSLDSSPAFDEDVTPTTLKFKPSFTSHDPITGTIFDSDDQIPTYLHTPITSIVGASDAVRNTVQTYRPMIEGLIIAWALLLMVFVGNAFARIFPRSVVTLPLRQLGTWAIRRLENESETVEWLNKFVQRLWTQMEPGLSASLKASLEPSLGSSMSMPVFTLGSAAPRIETIRTIAKTSDDVHLMDWDLNFTPREKELGEIRSSRIEVKYNMIPILIANIEFSGKLRVGIKYMTKHPHIKLIEYSFLEPPVVNFKLRPLKGIDLMDSGLSGLVAGIINSSLAGYVEPNKNIFDMEAFFEGTSSDVPVGVLKITIFEAKDLKNVELGGVSDPYAKIVIGDKEVARTSDISQSLSPYWGETYYIAVMKSHLEIPLTFLQTLASLPLAQWIRLLESDSSRLKNKASAVSITNSGDPMDIRGKVSGDKPLSKVDRNRLLTEWGTPFPEDSDVWKHVMHEEGGKPRGEVRVDLSYYPLPKTTETIEAPTPTASTVDEDPLPLKLVRQLKRRPRRFARKPRKLSCINGLARPPVSPSNVLGSTPAAKKTNNPVLNFAVKDEGRYLGTVTVPVKDLIQKKPPGNESDWYKLSAATGKLRVTCKWQPLDLENCHKNADVVRKEPIGMIRINLIEAKGVANVEAFVRKSDPYAKLHLSRRPIGATHVKENTLDPTWNEVFHAVCYSRNEPIRIELWDYNKVKKDLGLGRVEFLLEELLTPRLGIMSLRMLRTKEEVDLKRQAYLLKQKTDGLRVVKKGNIMDVWAPIYIVRNQDETEDSTTSTTALNMVGIGAGAKAGQKGHLHLEIEMLEVVGEHYVRPKTEEELKALSKLHDEAEDAERERISREDKDGEGLKGMVSLSELLKGPATDATHKLLLNYEPPVEVLKSYRDAGIVRLRVHELRGLENPAKLLCRTPGIRSGMPPLTSFSKTLQNSRAKVLVRTAGDDLKRQSNDPIVAVWTADILEVAGRRNVWVPLHPNGWEGNVGELRVSVGYAPIQMEADEDSSKTVDSAAPPTLYCIIALNDKPIHKTKVHKSKSAPLSTKLSRANIRSRLRSTLAHYHRTRCSLRCAVTLEGARGGFIRLRVLFVPQVLDESAFDDDVAAGDKKEDGRLAKFTKGLGSSAVGAITSSVEHLGGKAIPKQEQSGLTAEDIAKGRNAPIRSLGDAAGSPEPSDRPSSPIELARSLSAKSTFGGTSDPYIKVVQLVHGKEKVLHKTRVVKKTLDPVWAHESVTIRVPPNTVRIIMKDKNMFAESKPMGEIDLDLSTLLQQSKTSFDVWMPLGLGGMGEVRLTGVYRPEGVSRSASTASVALKVPAIHTDDEEESRPLSPAMSASSSRSSLYDGASINGGAPSIPKERKRLFSFGKKP